MAINARFVSNTECVGIMGIAVVIDVVRAFTTAAWAFHQGTERIVLTDDLDEALRLKQSIPDSFALRDGEATPGFDLTNSPAQMRDRNDLAGRTIVQRTTNGTIGAVAARGARVLFCASFVCASATAAAIRAEQDNEVWFVVTGEDGKADEDLAFAQYLAALIDEPATQAEAFVSRVGDSYAGRRVRSAGAAGSLAAHPEDVDLCMEVDRFDFAMRATEEDGLLVLRRT